MSLGKGMLKAFAVMPVGKIGNVVSKSPTVLGHIFRDVVGQVNPSTLTSQGRYLQLFESVANNPSALRIDAISAGLIPQQAADAGIQAFTQTFNRGQVWVLVKNGVIYDAGVNLIPR